MKSRRRDKVKDDFLPEDCITVDGRTKLENLVARIYQNSITKVYIIKNAAEEVVSDLPECIDTVYLQKDVSRMLIDKIPRSVKAYVFESEQHYRSISWTVPNGVAITFSDSAKIILNMANIEEERPAKKRRIEPAEYSMEEDISVVLAEVVEDMEEDMPAIVAEVVEDSQPPIAEIISPQPVALPSLQPSAWQLFIIQQAAGVNFIYPLFQLQYPVLYQALWEQVQQALAPLLNQYHYTPSSHTFFSVASVPPLAIASSSTLDTLQPGGPVRK